MEIEYLIEDKPVKWGSTTLKELVEHYQPTGWEEVFEAVADDVIPEISAALTKFSGKHTIYPPMPLVFNALDSIMPNDIKVVLIGQDPYIRKGEATGLSFSVPPDVKLPPSLRNIYKELASEGYSGYTKRKDGDLTEWLDKGVFLYNACLTVNAGDSASHKALWDDFTDIVINYLNRTKHVAWILLGKKAQRYAKALDRERHGVFKAGHPSPLNRLGDFAGSCVFQDSQRYLNKHGRDFTWDLP
jgi:uracil-DNA glycosylase